MRTERARPHFAFWIALTVVALACDESPPPDSPAETGGSHGTGGGSAQGGSAGVLHPPDCVPEDTWQACLGNVAYGIATYCETSECVGVSECRRCECDPCETRCACRWELPGAAGQGGGELEPAPDPYPGPGCPVDPNMAVNRACPSPSSCAYPPATPLCCVDKGEDVGLVWSECACPGGIPEAGTPCEIDGLRCGDGCEQRTCSGTWEVVAPSAIPGCSGG